MYSCHIKGALIVLFCLDRHILLWSEMQKDQILLWELIGVSKPIILWRDLFSLNNGVVTAVHNKALNTLKCGCQNSFFWRFVHSGDVKLKKGHSSGN